MNSGQTYAFYVKGFPNYSRRDDFVRRLHPLLARQGTLVAVEGREDRVSVKIVNPSTECIVIVRRILDEEAGRMAGPNPGMPQTQVLQGPRGFVLTIDCGWET